MAQTAQTALIMNITNFPFQNTRNNTFENPAIPQYSLKNRPDELGLSIKTAIASGSYSNTYAPPCR